MGNLIRPCIEQRNYLVCRSHVNATRADEEYDATLATVAVIFGVASETIMHFVVSSFRRALRKHSSLRMRSSYLKVCCHLPVEKANSLRVRVRYRGSVPTATPVSV